MRYRLPALLLLAILCSTPAATLQAAGASAAAPPEVDERQLQRLKREIKQLQQWLDSARDQRDELRQALRRSETEIGALVRQIDRNQRALQAQQRQLRTLKGERTELQLQRRQQETYLLRQVRAAYAMGRQQSLKILLNQEQPDRLARILRYYDYLNRERSQRIDEYTRTARRLAALEQDILVQTQQLAALGRSLQQRRRQLEAVKQERQQVLARLNQRIHGSDQKLGKLQQDRQRLEQLLEAVNQAIVDIPLPQDSRPFKVMRGKLPRPLDGRIRHAFGSEQLNGRLRRHGIVLSAREGQPVSAVHRGRVVFSDWLRGFGLLIIVDHGDGYLSLYGHNQALLKETGDWVQAGEAIATAGNSGGQTEVGLYFEIRHRGKPIDPVRWLARR